MNQQKLVLVVDHREEKLVLFHQVLRRFGYDVVLAAGGDEGLAQARRHRPDLVLLDVDGGDGLATAARLRADASTAAIPIAALSDRSLAMLEGESTGAAFCAVLPGRFRLGALLDILAASPGGAAAAQPA